MSIICISRGSYFRGREVAETVADRLGYSCVSRDSLLEASEEFSIPELKLMRNLHHSTHILERFSFGRERYINYISSAILRHLKKDNHVYHGIAGQFFLSEVKHLLKVRIVADFEERVRTEAERENISLDQARAQLKQDDEERQKWAMVLYGIDIVDPSLYDLVINLSSMGVAEAVEIIITTARQSCFQPTEATKQKIEDLACAAEIRASLFEFPRAGVSVADGIARVAIKAPEEQATIIMERVEAALKNIAAIRELEIRVDPYF